MKLIDRIKECSNIWIIYIIVGSFASALIGMSIYLLLLFWSIFYYMDNTITSVISLWYIKWVLILVVESIFIIAVLRGLYKETGDTVLIDIIKHGYKNKESQCISTSYRFVTLDDIKVSLKDKIYNIDSLSQLSRLNSEQHGYIHFNNVNDICFCTDLKIFASKPSQTYVLKVEHCHYSGRRLLGKHDYNVLSLYGVEQIDASLIGDGSYKQKNNYINRLFHADVYDYPLSFKEDIEKGVKDSRVSICIIVSCLVIIFCIYGWYRNYSSSSFMSDFTAVDSVEDIVIYSDNSIEYLDYRTYIVDSLALLPTKLKDDFVSSGWNLIFVQHDLANYEMLSSMVASGTTSGCTFPFYKLIVIELPDKESDLNQSYLMQTIIHEYGHFLSLKMNAINDEWQNIYNLEKNNYSTEYAKSNVSEAFASGYSSYILYKDMFSSKTPLSYNFIKDIERKYLVGEKL